MSKLNAFSRVIDVASGMSMTWGRLVDYNTQISQQQFDGLPWNLVTRSWSPNDEFQTSITSSSNYSLAQHYRIKLNKMKIIFLFFLLSTHHQKMETNNKCTLILSIVFITKLVMSYSSVPYAPIPKHTHQPQLYFY